MSLYATLLAVGLPVWLAHWGPVAAPGARRWVADEPQALARRLYLYLTLLAGVLTLLGSGAVAARQVLDLVLGEAATGGALTNLARALAVAPSRGGGLLPPARAARRRGASARAGRGPGPSRPPSQAGPHGAVTCAPVRDRHRRHSAEGSEWFSTAGEARDALVRLNSSGMAWIGPPWSESRSPRGEGAPRLTPPLSDGPRGVGGEGHLAHSVVGRFLGNHDVVWGWLSRKPAPLMRTNWALRCISVIPPAPTYFMPALSPPTSW